MREENVLLAWHTNHHQPSLETGCLGWFQALPCCCGLVPWLWFVEWVKIQYEFGFEWGLFDSDNDWKVSIILKENSLCQSFSCSPRLTIVFRFDKRYEQKLILFWSNYFCYTDIENENSEKSKLWINSLTQKVSM